MTIFLQYIVFIDWKRAKLRLEYNELFMILAAGLIQTNNCHLVPLFRFRHLGCSKISLTHCLPISQHFSTPGVGGLLQQQHVFRNSSMFKKLVML